jgi:hypothetical protein
VSYINDALKKAQKERNSRPNAYSPLHLSSGESRRAGRRWYGVAAALGIAVFLAAAFTVLFTREATDRAAPGRGAPAVAEHAIPPAAVAPPAALAPAAYRGETPSAPGPAAIPSGPQAHPPSQPAVGTSAAPRSVPVQATASGTGGAVHPKSADILSVPGTRAAAAPVRSSGQGDTRRRRPDEVPQHTTTTHPEGRPAAKTEIRTDNAPRDVESLYAQALEKQKMRRFAEAEAIYQDILAWNGGHVRSLNNLGVIYLAQGRKTLAAEMFRQAVALDANYADPHYNLACLYVGQGDLKHGLRSLQEAAAIDTRVKGWAREDADLRPLEALPEYRVFLEKD